MPNKCKSITGQRFGKLVVIKLIKQTTKGGLWECLCDCGKILSINRPRLIDKIFPKTHCGCSRKCKDISGQRFGKLVAVSRIKSGHQFTGGGRSSSIWLLKCDCGQVASRSIDNLKNTSHCGCGFANNITGQKFGILTAIKIVGRKKNSREFLWLFKCECGTEKKLSSSDVNQRIKRGKGKPISCGCLTKVPLETQKRKRRISTENRRAWRIGAKGNFTSKLWKEKIQFYSNKCYLCLSPLNDNVLHIEHKIPLSRGGTNWIANLAPACQSCNLKKGSLTEKEYREKVKKAANL